MTDDHLTSVIVDAGDAKSAEDLVRATSVHLGCSVALSSYPMSGRDLKRTAVKGTLTLARGIGQAIAEGRHAGDPVQALVNYLRATPCYSQCRILFDGKVVDIRRETKLGFSIGHCKLAALDGSVSAMEISFQNEHLIARQEGRVKAVVPDLICLVDRETAEPIPVERVKYGQRLKVIATSAAPIMRTPEALAMFGPQGTLYGKNTTAGTVKFASRKPGDEAQANLAVEYGRKGRLLVEGAGGGQVAPGLGVRVAAQTVQQGEGFQTNRTTGGDVGEIDRTAYRILVDWRPSEAVGILATLHGGHDSSDPPLLNVNNILDPSDDAYFEDEFSSAAGGPLRQDVESFGGSLSIDWAVSEPWTIASVTGYADFSRFYQEDRDGSALVHLDGFYDNEIEQFSQELCATYIDDSLVLILGGFFGWDEVDTRDQFDSKDLLPQFGLGGSTAVGNFYSQETETKALFGHSEWRLNDDWRLNLGLRYTDDRKDFSNAFTFVITPNLTTGGGALCPLRPAGDPAVLRVSDGIQTGCYPPVENDCQVSDLSGKAGIDYTGIDGALIYASVSKGFKSGGFQGQLAFNPADLAGFEEETLLAYEIGFKSRPASAAERRGLPLRLRGPAVLRAVVRLALRAAVRHRQRRQRRDPGSGAGVGLGGGGRFGHPPWLGAAGHRVDLILPAGRGQGQRAAQLPGGQLQCENQLRLALRRWHGQQFPSGRCVQGQGQLRHRPAAAGDA